MYELKNDKFYELIKKYPDCCIDYCLMKGNGAYHSINSHKDAVLFAIERFSEADGEDEPLWEYDIEKAEAKKIAAKSFFAVPDSIQDEKKDGTLPYWFAFLKPPHENGYTKEDFFAVNRALFPCGVDLLDIYEWSTDWSDYFDEGHEWWGAACWSIYDGKLDRYTVIMASATD